MSYRRINLQNRHLHPVGNQRVFRNFAGIGKYLTWRVFPATTVASVAANRTNICSLGSDLFDLQRCVWRYPYQEDMIAEHNTTFLTYNYARAQINFRLTLFHLFSNSLLHG